MSHTENKVDWCLKKAEKELEKSSNHRGLVKILPDLERAKEHIKKAEHYLKATDYLKKDFSDISTSTLFYSMYHCLLAISLKSGYESRNQECTFALIYSLIEDKKINFDKELINKIASLEINQEEESSVEIREQYQYGTSLSIKDDVYNKLFELAKEVISKTKEIIFS